MQNKRQPFLNLIFLGIETGGNIRTAYGTIKKITEKKQKKKQRIRV